MLYHLYERPEGSADHAFYPQSDKTQTSPQFIIMNSATRKKELTAGFLEYFYDYMNREGSPRKYPELTEEAENVAASWKYSESEIEAPVLKAKNAVMREKNRQGGHHEFRRSV